MLPHEAQGFGRMKIKKAGILSNASQTEGTKGVPPDDHLKFVLDLVQDPAEVRVNLGITPFVPPCQTHPSYCYCKHAEGNERIEDRLTASQQRHVAHDQYHSESKGCGTDCWSDFVLPNVGTHCVLPEVTDHRDGGKKLDSQDADSGRRATQREDLGNRICT